MWCQLSASENEWDSIQNPRDFHRKTIENIANVLLFCWRCWELVKIRKYYLSSSENLQLSSVLGHDRVSVSSCILSFWNTFFPMCRTVCQIKINDTTSQLARWLYKQCEEAEEFMFFRTRTGIKIFSTLWCKYWKATCEIAYVM